ncbi:MAG: YidC/Oxa1 family membrane protein insertase [Spirochaetia bacterium]|nr:YidC/Oxa1 family membrane protein insertase [Spirochaetia bacterium]
MNILYLIFIYPIELLIELVFQFSYWRWENCGISLAAVSLAVSFLSLPLYIIAERWQQKERDIQKAFKPEIDEIKAVFKGDERYMILSTFYRQNHYHPIMALRSSISLMIQVPFFIAAYVFLSNLEMLRGQSLWFIRDLGAPDQLFSIGSFQVNVLPIAMTIINIVASAVYVNGFAFKEKLQLYGMAALFLVLLYNSPAGLVFYWTLNNVFSLCKNICYKVKFKKSETLEKSLQKVYCFCRRPLVSLYQENSLRFGIFFLCCIAFLLLVGAVIPSSLICSSVQEFSYIEPYESPLGIFQFPFLQAMGIAVWMVALYFLFSRKTQTVFTFLLFAGIVGALINTYVFAGGYGTVMVQNGLIFENGLKIKNELAKFPIDIATMLVVISGVLFVLSKGWLKPIKNVCTILVLTLLAFSIFNVAKINSEFHRFKAIVADSSNKGADETIKPVYHFSRTGKNVVVIMLDRGISSFVPYIMDELPQVKAGFQGFVWYPNTLAPGDHTIFSAPAIFGGYDYLPQAMNERNNQLLIEKHNKSLKVLPSYFLGQGYTATVTDPPMANYSWIPDNSIFDKKIHAVNLAGRYDKLWRRQHNMELTGFVLADFMKRDFLFFDFFRVCPVSLRGILYDHGGWWSSIKYKAKDKNSWAIKYYSVLDYLSELSDVVEGAGAYMAIDNDLPHEPTWMQYPEYVLQSEITEKGENRFGDEAVFIHYHANAATLRMLGEWFAWMRSKGVYDNTRIVIASDHGRHFKGENITLDTDFDRSELAAWNALLLFKDFGASGDIWTDNTFMTVADVPSLAISGTDRREEKKEGMTVVTGLGEASDHGKYKFNYTEKYRVKDNIFKAANWEKLK